MNIKFIGTGTMGSITRGNTSILIDNILFDCGMGTVKQLERYKKYTKNIKYVLITHFHADHFFDIPNLLVGRRSRGEIDNKLYIIISISGRRKVIDMMKFSFGNGIKDAYENIEEKYNVEFIELDVDEKYEFEDYEIEAIQQKHGNCIPTYGYLLRKDGITIGYTGDTSVNENLFKMCQKADYMFTDATTYAPIEGGDHMSFEELREISEKYNSCKFYAVHRGDYEIKNKGKVIVPNDGEEFETI